MINDFSPRDFKLIPISVSHALESIYPEVHPQAIKELQINLCLKVIARLARFCLYNPETFHTIPEDLTNTIYQDVQYLDVVTTKIKILLFKNEENITAYFYPRRFEEKTSSVEYESMSRGTIKVDVDLENGNSVFRVVTQLVSKIVSDTEEQKQFDKKFSDHAQNTSMLSNNSAILPLFHHISYQQDPTEVHEKNYTKYRLFQEKFPTSFALHRELLAQKGKEGMNNNTIRVFFCLVSTVYRLRKTIYHGMPTLDNFYYRDVKMSKKIVVTGLHFSRNIEPKVEKYTCENKHPLFSGYESIKEMVRANSLNRSEEGLASDVWTLGCSLYQYYTSYYPDFALFVSFAPKFNYLCVLLSQKRDEIDARMHLDPQGLSPFRVTPHETLNIKKLRKDWLTAERLDEEKIPKIKADLEALIEGSVNLGILVSRLQPHRMDVFSEESQCGLILKMSECIEEIFSAVQDMLVGDDSDETGYILNLEPELIELYNQVCNEIFTSWEKYLRTLIEAERILQEERNVDNPLQRLIQKMMRPDPSRRITIEKAYRFLIKSYPDIYESLHKKGSIKPIQRINIPKIKFNKRH